jgi:hypothetical protein
VESRYFSQTGFTVDRDAFWDFFQKRGGVRTFGYPVSRSFTLAGSTVQIFQRGVLQLTPSGGVATMNLLDSGLMPYTQINGSTFPDADPELLLRAPSVYSSGYAEAALGYVMENVPSDWDGIAVRFRDAFLSTVGFSDAFPDGNGDPGLTPLMDLELWGMPTSRPTYDPNNHNFVYQRFQRGFMHYDAGTGQTQGLLLGDYFKRVITGRDVPPDLERQARGSMFFMQYAPGMPGWLSRPGELPNTNMERAFEPEAR